VADVFREHGGAYLKQYGASADQKRLLRDLAACRTAALGGHVKRCDRCGHEEFFYKSCGNRHCPKCQAEARAKWLEAQAADLLQTQYFHVVFTLSHRLGPIALQNKRLIYGILFRAVSETLLQIARDPKHLGAVIGFVAVLHTWGQRLNLHPHIHCVVPGGGISPDGKRWIASPKDFLLPIKVLSRVFRGKFLEYLRRAFSQGELVLEGTLQHLRNPRSWDAMLKSLKKSDWIVYAKPPFGGAKRVLKYLARYTHRVAISNQRLVSMEDGKVTFLWKDYADGCQEKPMTLEAAEFIRRFLLHHLPGHFQRIRHYGMLANRVRKEKLELARKLLGENDTSEPPTPEALPALETDSPLEQNSHPECCPACKQGRLLLLREIQPDRRLVDTLFEPQRIDSS
jgi:hypothetical protein